MSLIAASGEPSAGLVLWEPQPLVAPSLPPEFDRLPHVPRSFESVRFALARLERWLSPEGWLRAWLRLNLIIAVVLCCSAVLVLPVVGHVFAELVAWTGMADTIAGHLSGAVLRLPPLVMTALSVPLLILLWRHLRRRGWSPSLASRHEERHGFDDYR